MSTIHTIDEVGFFDALASEMNAHPETFEVLGDVSMRIAVVMRRGDGEPFAVLLTFEGIACAGVDALDVDELSRTDCWLDGPLEAWQEMFDDIVAHGHATGRLTINSLTLLGDRITVHGADPLGVDRFFRFNQTVQAFLDGAAAVVAAPAASPGS